MWLDHTMRYASPLLGKARQWPMETNILAHFCFNVVLLSWFLFVFWVEMGWEGVYEVT